METLKALSGADDAEKWFFSGLTEIQCTQRFREDTMFKEGDSVVVKPGIVDPDFGTQLSDCQGLRGLVCKSLASRPS